MTDILCLWCRACKRSPNHLQPHSCQVFNEKRAVMTKALLVCGAIAGPLFVVGFLFIGATRANYDLLRHPVSSLALGDYGWVQSANFVVTGLLTLALSVGLQRALRLGKGST